MGRYKIRKAFRELRKNGYFARMNFWCCQSCAWSMVPDGNDNAVFFHQQDNETLERSNNCYLAWAGDGDYIVSVLKEHDISVDWDGSPNTRIHIIV